MKAPLPSFHYILSINTFCYIFYKSELMARPISVLNVPKKNVPLYPFTQEYILLYPIYFEL